MACHHRRKSRWWNECGIPLIRFSFLTSSSLHVLHPDVKERKHFLFYLEYLSLSLSSHKSWFPPFSESCCLTWSFPIRKKRKIGALQREFKKQETQKLALPFDVLFSIHPFHSFIGGNCQCHFDLHRIEQLPFLLSWIDSAIDSARLLSGYSSLFDDLMRRACVFFPKRFSPFPVGRYPFEVIVDSLCLSEWDILPPLFIPFNWSFFGKIPLVISEKLTTGEKRSFHFVSIAVEWGFVCLASLSSSFIFSRLVIISFLPPPPAFLSFLVLWLCRHQETENR